MLHSVEGVDKNGIIELAETPQNMSESRVIVTFLQSESVVPCLAKVGLAADRLPRSKPRTQQMIYFGMFGGANQSTEEDFQLAEFHADIDDNLDWL